MIKIILAGMFGSIMVYLFATAPAPLPDRSVTAIDDCQFEVQSLFDGVNAINDAARSIYTKRVVGGGKLAGLAFGEDWQEPTVEKGPLPALFLRLTAARLETKPPPLGLYLGSDAPINKSNLFTPEQLVSFEEVKTKRTPVFLLSAVAGNVGMYPDVAGVAPCVDCHNDHEDSPKTDWKLGDVMGATTWTYPDKTLNLNSYFSALEATFVSVQEAYQLYLDKTTGFELPVGVGENWPKEGRRTLPDADVFLAEVRAAAAAQLVEAMLPVDGLGDVGKCAS
ncbi:hypothetical protein BXY66_1338 [Shimia isoporae]|uniref:Tll0287-like domain-containing protein n=1 Tax=Shimia isoporae TaxID=647720 RepID=A0A4R1NRD1_9RHOB|nr:DUF3365 domain-containing protein [Shimia isoporae]TCL09293.1 hypothetical protein BXY66_1338 [Shimia isoporae]